jgi:hypothetical protein
VKIEKGFGKAKANDRKGQIGRVQDFFERTCFKKK